MGDDHGPQILHAQGRPLRLGLVEEGLGDNDAVGTPLCSSAIPSCIQHDVQEPQSPMAVTAASFSAATRAISSGAAGDEKLSVL